MEEVDFNDDELRNEDGELPTAEVLDSGAVDLVDCGGAKGLGYVAKINLEAEHRVIDNEAPLTLFLHWGVGQSVCHQCGCLKLVGAEYPLSLLCTACESVVWCSRDCWSCDPHHEPLACRVMNAFRVAQFRGVMSLGADQSELWNAALEHLHRFYSLVAWWLTEPDAVKKERFLRLSGRLDDFDPASEQLAVVRAYVTMVRRNLEELATSSEPLPGGEDSRMRLTRSAALLETLVAKLLVNCFTLHSWRTGTPVSLGCTVYHHLSRFNHSCEPNCRVHMTEDGRGTVFTDRAIAAGEELTISYIDQSQCVEERREKLRQRYNFVCQCARCVRESSIAENTN